jgi:hypothetical protein
MSKDFVKNSLFDNVTEFTNPLTDKELCDLMDYIAVTASNDIDAKPNELQDKFIKNFFGQTNWDNYLIDLFNKEGYTVFKKCSGYARENIAEINRMLLIIAFFRFKDATDKPVKPVEPTVKLTKSEKSDFKTVLEYLIRDNEDKLDDEVKDIMSHGIDEEEAVEIYEERKRHSKLFPKLLKLTK